MGPSQGVCRTDPVMDFDYQPSHGLFLLYVFFLLSFFLAKTWQDSFIYLCFWRWTIVGWHCVGGMQVHTLAMDCTFWLSLTIHPHFYFFLFFFAYLKFAHFLCFWKWTIVGLCWDVVCWWCTSADLSYRFSIFAFPSGFFPHDCDSRSYAHLLSFFLNATLLDEGGRLW